MTDQEKEIVVSIEIEEGYRFKRFIEAFSSMIYRATVEFDKFGMFIIAVSEGRIGYTEFNLPKSYFTNYDCAVSTEIIENENGEEEEIGKTVSIDLNIVDFNKVLSGCGKNDSITIEFAKIPIEDEETEEVILQQDNKITIKMRGETENGRIRTRRFRLALEELPEEFKIDGKMQLDELYIWKAKMEYSILKDVVEDADKVSEKLEIEIEDESKIKVFAGAILGDYEEELEGEGIEITLIDGAESQLYDATFPIEQLKATIKMAEESEGDFIVQFGYREDEPCPIRFRMSVLGEGIMDYYVAPMND